MIQFDSNIKDVVSRLTKKLNSIDTDAMGQEMATTVIGMMRKRIHEDGKASDNSGIGTYSSAYMKVRTGNFRSSARVSRGKNKGNPKNAGTYVRGAKKGQMRPKYNRTTSTDVILSLTREMENDFGTMRLQRGVWAIGFIRNPNRSKKGKFTHIDIADNAESVLYNKPIYRLNTEEQTTVDLIAARYVINALNNTAI